MDLSCQHVSYTVYTVKMVHGKSSEASIQKRGSWQTRKSPLISHMNSTLVPNIGHRRTIDRGEKISEDYPRLTKACFMQSSEFISCFLCHASACSVSNVTRVSSPLAWTAGHETLLGGRCDALHAGVYSCLIKHSYYLALQKLWWISLLTRNFALDWIFEATNRFGNKFIAEQVKAASHQ